MVTRWHAAALFGLCVALAVPPARADHTAEDRQTEWSAYSLRRNQWRLGLFKFEYGIFDQWAVGTYTLPWLLIPITQSPTGNLYTKVKFLDTGRVAAAVKAAAFLIDVEDYDGGDIDDGDFGASIFPLTASVSALPLEPLTVSAEATWVQTLLTGDVTSAGDAVALGAGAQSNLQFALTAEWRLSRKFALNLVTRLAAYVTPVRISTSTDVDDSTSADIDAELTAEDAEGGWLVQPGVTYSTGPFNLRAGLGYGNLFIPGLLIVGPQKMPVPDFDIYFRF